MKNNVCITGLLNNYSENIAMLLSKDLEVYFANVLSLLQFDIVDISNTIEVCGIDYYRDQVVKKLKELSKFEDIIIYCNYYFLQYPECRDIFKNNLLTIYLDLGEEDYNEKIKLERLTELEAKLEKGAYRVRNKFFSKNCDIVIKCKGLTDSQVINQIKLAMIEYYKVGVEKNGSRKKNSK